MLSVKQVEVLIRRPGHPERRVSLARGILALGRAEDNDLVLPDVGVSRRHARLHVTDDAVLVEDMGSGNGTWFRGQRVARQVLGDGDEVTIDPFTLRLAVQGPAANAEVTDGRDATAQLGATVPFARLTVISAHKMDQRDFTLPTAGIVTLGRSDKNGIVLPEPASSRVHAEIACSLEAWVLKDHGSSNGTFVNARRVKERVLEDGDRIRIGTVELRFGLVNPAENGPERTENFDANLHSGQPGPPPTVPVPVSQPMAWAPAPDASTPNLPRVAGGGFGAAPTVVHAAPPVPPRPEPWAAGPASAPLPLTAPPPHGGGFVEIDVDASKVRAKKGPRVRGKGGGGFLSRPINQISIGLVAITILLVGGKATIDVLRALMTSSHHAGATTTAAPVPTARSESAAPLDPAAEEQVARGMAEGMRLFQEGKQFDAAAQFYKVLQVDPGNADAKRMGFVACESIAVQTMRASLELRTASEAKRAAAKAAAIAAVQSSLAGEGTAADARARIAEALQLNPGDAEIDAAAASLDQRQASLVRAVVREKSEKQARSLQQLVDDGQRDFDRGQYAKAVASWERVTSTDSTRSSPQFYAADEGIRAAKDKMKAESRKDYTAGLNAMKNGDWLSARSALERVARSDPYNEAAKAKLSEVRGHLKDQASDYYTEARTLEGINQTEKALALYQKVITYVGDDGDPLAQKAQSRMTALMQ